jgi:hypothetical protein
MEPEWKLTVSNRSGQGRGDRDLDMMTSEGEADLRCHRGLARLKPEPHRAQPYARRTKNSEVSYATVHHQQPVIPKRVSVTSGHPENIAADRLRRDLALVATERLIIIALIAALQSGAMPVLYKLLP